MIVVDASVLAPALADDGPDGDRARTELVAAGPLVAPEIIDLEVVSVLRKAALAGRLDDRRARLALDDLAALPMRRVPHGPLVGRVWELRANLTAYDAAYVVIAELVRAPLLTADQRLAGAPGLPCEVITLPERNADR